MLDGLDPAVRDVVAAALSKDPGARPAARELLARLVGQDRADPARTAETVSTTWQGFLSAEEPAPAPPVAHVPAPRPVPDTEAPAAPPPAPAPEAAETVVHVDLPYPASWNGPRRWLTPLRGLLVLPHLTVMLLLCAALVPIMLLSWFVIPFTGRYPRRLHGFAAGCQRWTSRVVAYAFGLTGEKLPPFRTLPKARRTAGR